MVAIELSKIVVVTVNVVFMIFGLACVIVGVVFKLGWDEVRDAFADDVTNLDFNLQNAGDTVGVAAIAFGAFIIIVSLLGCLGACFKLRLLLIIYAVIVLILVLGQISVVAFAAVKGKDAEDDLETALTDTLKHYNETSPNARSKAWSAIFSLAECCAVTNFKNDFMENPFDADVIARKEAGIKGKLIPITCCRGVDYEDELTVEIFQNKNKCLDTPTSKNAYVEGCYTKVKDWIDHSKKVLLGVGCTILIIEMILVFMAFIIFCRSD